MAEETLDVLLVEDNPGDARLVEEILHDARPQLGRIDLDGSTPERSELHHESDLESGLERLSETDVDVVLLDLNLPDSAGLNTLVSVVDATEFTPIVVLTGQDDRDLGIRTIQKGAHDYLVKDDLSAGLLIHSLQYAIEQAHQERERARHREQLEAFNRLYRISQDVTHALIRASTRDELERAVCERLVDSDAYSYAWLGGVQHGTGRFSARESAPSDCGFEVGAIPLDDDAAVERPEAKAVRSREVQIVQDVEAAPEFEASREQMRACGYRSMVAIPVAYETVCYGIVAIYDESPNAFVETEPEHLSRLGQTIGHAITAVERRDALVSDTALQLTFSRDGEPGGLVAASAQEWTLELERLIQTDSAILAYGSADGISEVELHDAVDRSTLVEDLRVLSPGPDEYDIELTTNWGEELVPELAKHGGLVTSVTISDGRFEFVVEVPPGRDKHQLVDLVQDHCPDATVRAQRTVHRDDPTVTELKQAFENKLTEKQRAVLEAAYHAGYFEWPRRSTGEEIADRLGVTQATFSEHFRGAERTLFGTIFESDPDQDMVPPSPWASSAADASND